MSAADGCCWSPPLGTGRDDRDMAHVIRSRLLHEVQRQRDISRSSPRSGWWRAGIGEPGSAWSISPSRCRSAGDGAAQASQAGRRFRGRGERRSRRGRRRTSPLSSEAGGEASAARAWAAGSRAIADSAARRAACRAIGGCAWSGHSPLLPRCRPERRHRQGRGRRSDERLRSRSPGGCVAILVRPDTPRPKRRSRSACRRSRRSPPSRATTCPRSPTRPS